jgi:hypothetical protein
MKSYHPTSVFGRIQRDLRLLWNSPIDYIQTCFDPTNIYIQVRPYEPKSAQIAQKVIRNIRKVSPDMPIQFVGSASMGISAISNDIDFLVSCKNAQERSMFTMKLSALYGAPVVFNNRFVKWEIMIHSYKVEIILAYPWGRMYKNLIRAYNALSKNKHALNQYEKFKEAAHGMSFREYQKNKLDFFNNIIHQS